MRYNPTHEISSKLILPVHGVTTRMAGSFQTHKSRTEYVAALVSNLNDSDIYRVHQIHSSFVHTLDSSDTPQSVYALDADGLVLQKRKSPTCIYITVADCIPLFLWDSNTSTCAVVHSGWKGTHENIALHAIESMVKLKSKIADIRAFIGPYIHACCYTVNETRADVFKPTYTKSVLGVQHLDIGAVVNDQLIELGMAIENIDHSSLCTSCDKRFFSYRRENADTHGTMIAYIVV